VLFHTWVMRTHSRVATSQKSSICRVACRWTGSIHPSAAHHSTLTTTLGVCCLLVQRPNAAWDVRQELSVLYTRFYACLMTCEWHPDTK
jgi:hypothetical protein